MGLNFIYFKRIHSLVVSTNIKIIVGLKVNKNLFLPTLSILDMTFDLIGNQSYYTEIISKLKEYKIIGSTVHDSGNKQSKTYFCGLMKGRLNLEFVVNNGIATIMKVFYSENQPLHFRVPCINQITSISEFLMLNNHINLQPASDSYYSILWSSKSGKLSTLMFHRFGLRTQKTKSIYNNSYHKLVSSKYNGTGVNGASETTFPDFLGMIPIKFQEELFKTKMSKKYLNKLGLMLSIPLLLSQDATNLVASVDPRVFTSYDMENKGKSKSDFSNNPYR